MDRIIILIRQYGGYPHQTAGLFMGFFDDPALASDCAQHIAGAVVYGSQLTVPAPSSANQNAGTASAATPAARPANGKRWKS